MKKEAVLHNPMSNYAHGTSEERLVIRLRTAKDDCKDVSLFVGDTACRNNPIDFYEVKMVKVAWDLYFDYYEAEFDSRYKRIYYYFELSDEDEKFYYFSGFFRKDLPDDRSEYYKLPFNHRADIADVPDWVRDAVIYNIFPDSFATKRGVISKKETQALFRSEKYTRGVSTKGKLGGTIRGITENVDYLSDLGINCIYINPIFAACEYHKYDTLDYYCVDPNFGTNSDFREMVDTLHKKGIRVIIDGVFNHCGWKFFAFEDVVKNGEKSRYKDWFYGLTFPVIRPDDPDAYPNYECFAYERLMPKLNTENPEVRELLIGAGEYWVREFDIDGWRLDVASEVNDNFWRKFRRRIKAIKPDAFIIGEVWESAAHWMQGDMYDSVMNYDLRKFSQYFFAKDAIDAATFNAGVTDMLLRYKKNLTGASLNLLDSHDVSRFLSVCDENVNRFKEAVVFQMMFIGVPSVFYGDEQGFTGNLECEYRRPMCFSESGELFEFYRKLIAIRKNKISIRRGSFKTVSATERVFIFERQHGDEKITVVLNNGGAVCDLSALNVAKILLENGYDRDGQKLSGLGFLIFEE